MITTNSINSNAFPSIKGKNTFCAKDLFKESTGIPSPTIYSRIRRLVDLGVIYRIGRGKYALGEKPSFCPVIDEDARNLMSCLNDEFPYSSIVIWNLNEINSFLQHLINMNITFVDIDRQCVESAYWFLKGKGYNVITRKRMLDDLSEYDGCIFIRPLVTSSPNIKIEGLSTSSLEKILVDLACDKEFNSFHGSELTHIYENAFGKFAINSDRLLRYAGRKNKRKYISSILNKIYLLREF